MAILLYLPSIFLPVFCFCFVSLSIFFNNSLSMFYLSICVLSLYLCFVSLSVFCLSSCLRFISVVAFCLCSCVVSHLSFRFHTSLYLYLAFWGKL
jgi:hypothetical protein